MGRAEESILRVNTIEVYGTSIFRLMRVSTVVIARIHRSVWVRGFLFVVSLHSYSRLLAVRFPIDTLYSVKKIYLQWTTRNMLYFIVPSFFLAFLFASSFPPHYSVILYAMNKLADFPKLTRWQINSIGSNKRDFSHFLPPGFDRGFIFQSARRCGHPGKSRRKINISRYAREFHENDHVGIEFADSCNRAVRYTDSCGRKHLSR